MRLCVATRSGRACHRIWLLMPIILMRFAVRNCGRAKRCQLQKNYYKHLTLQICRSSVVISCQLSLLFPRCARAPRAKVLQFAKLYLRAGLAHGLSQRRRDPRPLDVDSATAH